MSWTKSRGVRTLGKFVPPVLRPTPCWSLCVRLTSSSMRISILLLILSSGCCLAQTGLPDDAARLKQAHAEACEKALKPINERYLSELNKLLAAHTKAGNLESALAIKEEITRLTQTNIPAPDPSQSVADSTGQSKKIYRELADSTWTTDWYSMTVTLTADGSVSFSSPRPGAGWRWKVSEDGKLLLSLKADGEFRNAKLTDKRDQFVIPFGSEGAKVCTRQSKP